MRLVLVAAFLVASAGPALAAEADSTATATPPRRPRVAAPT
jgi:hypothetical protein